MKTPGLIRIGCVFPEDYRIQHSSGLMPIPVRHIGGLQLPSREYEHASVSRECITRFRHMSLGAMNVFRREAPQDGQR